MGPAPHPNNRRAGISRDVLREMYVVQALPLYKVAERLQLAPTTVSRRLAELGLRTRPRGPVPRASLAHAEAFTWTGNLAWVVGFIATDGNLSSNGRTVCVTSKDVDVLESVRACLRLSNAIVANSGGYGRTFRLQWTSRRFHSWLMSLGLTPAKALALGTLSVPDAYFADFLRGCIDGDGSIITYVDRHNTAKNPTYVYERLFVSLVSASPSFLQWIRREVHRLLGISGHLTVGRRVGRRDLWRLRYAKRDSVMLLKWMYYDPHVVALGRKRERAERALRNPTWYRHSLSGVERR